MNLEPVPKFFDAHGHLNFVAYKDDRADVIQRALDAGVWVNVVGTQKDTSKDAVVLAEKYPEGVYATIGLHPIHTDKSYHDKEELGDEGKEFTSRGEEFDYDYYKKLAESSRVVAIGECGLDYYRMNNELGIMNYELEEKKQKEVFVRQIKLAEEVKKPLMIHCRDGKKSGTGKAFDDLVLILKSSLGRVSFNSHSFVRDIGLAKKLLDLGSFFSFNGIITFSQDYYEVIRYLPKDRILTETDCPYLTPVPHRGTRNESLYVVEIVKKIAEIRGEDFEKVRETIFQNASQFFNF
jgi:TatD DNase family protein